MTTNLAQISGTVLCSERDPSISYRIERCIGEGGAGIVFFALREAPDGVTPVVVKVVRPEVAATAGEKATMLVQKEAVALGRLNERVPPCPFVVRFVDVGSHPFVAGSSLPWLAVEYVHGGIEGTTLEERVYYSCAQTGFAFDAQRAAHVLKCLSQGLSAIHSVGVIHRDLTPGNVLCCGFGEAEIFKISDFGIARPRGLRATFGNVLLGTPGYTAPEQNFESPKGVGPYTDIFSFACLMYYVLTGERYFAGESPLEALAGLRQPRRPLLDSQWLAPELRQREHLCRAMDRIISQATSEDPSERFDDAQQFAASMMPWLAQRNEPPRPSRAIMHSVLSMRSPSMVDHWTWTVRHPPGDERIIHSAAWDVDGHCLVTTTRGVQYWTGDSWVNSLPSDRDLPKGLRFARRMEADCWLLGGAGGKLAVYSSEGLRQVLRCPDETITFLQASGRIDDLLTAVAERPGHPPELWAMAARRWMKPLPLNGVAYVSALLRLDDDRFLICGRLAQGGGFAALYRPMYWETTFLLVPKTRAFVAGSSSPERGLSLVVGSSGVALRVEGEQAVSSVAEGTPDLTASAMDVLDREWVASKGRLWVRDPARSIHWRPVWSDPNLDAPFISLIADAGLIVAMTVDGAVIEGRADWRGSPQPR